MWLDYTTQTVENQEVFWVPTNKDTQTIGYDTKILKSSEGRYPPIKWTVTKIEDTATEGIAKFTMAQDQFNPAKDDAVNMIAEYFVSAVEPIVPELEETLTYTNLEITYSGSPAVRAGGGYKKFTLKSRIDDKLADITGEVKWSVDFGDDSEQLISTVDGNIIKIKCKPDYYLIGKTFTITAQHEHSSTSLIVEVTSL